MNSPRYMQAIAKCDQGEILLIEFFLQIGRCLEEGANIDHILRDTPTDLCLGIRRCLTSLPVTSEEWDALDTGPWFANFIDKGTPRRKRQTTHKVLRQRYRRCVEAMRAAMLRRLPPWTGTS